MRARERFRRALKHERPDRVPMAIQFAATKYDEFVERTGCVDPYEYFQLDYRHVCVKPPRSLPDFSPYFQGRVPAWPENINSPDFELKPFRNSGSYFLMGQDNTAMNEWGEYRIYGNDLDYHEKVFPLDRMDCSLKDVKNYPFPDLFDKYRYDGIETEIAKLHQSGLAAVLSWEMTIFEKAWRIRGFEQLMMDFLVNPELVESLLDEIARRTGYLAKRYAQAGVDLIQLGDDISSQRGMLVSPQLWRKFLKPRLSKVVAAIKAANIDTLIFYHSDGNVEPVIPDLIEIGIDVLNPLQPECMNIADLHNRYGEDLAFWGGIGVQTVMPFGSKGDVSKAVMELIEVTNGREGGLMICPGHLIERDIPWDNVMAFVEAVRAANA